MNSEPVAARASLPGMLVGAAVILFVAGALSALIGLLVLASSAFYDQMPNSSGMTDEDFRAAIAAGKVFAVAFGIAGVIAAAAHIGAGVGMLRRAGWARIIGMVLAVLLILVTAFLLIATLVAMSQPASPGSLAGSGLTEEQYGQIIRLGGGIGVGVFGVSLAAYLFVLVALIRRGDAFN
jgi:hypothetical protein